MSKNPGILDDFQPLMPSAIRLLAGIIVLLVVQGIVLGFPGINQPLPSSTVSVSSLLVLAIGLIGAVVVYKFGTQFSTALGENYHSYKDYAPWLTYFFQVASLWVVYTACKAIATPYFTSTPWAYPMIFLALAIVPTIRFLASIVQRLEGHTTKQAQRNF